jgi:hypothetical protein
MRPTQRGVAPSRTPLHKGKIQSAERRRNARTEKQGSAAGTSLLERLPTELLSLIVTIFLEDDDNIIAITQVSRRFRQVAFGMSSIWRAIRLLTENPIFYEPSYKYEEVRDLHL